MCLKVRFPDRKGVNEVSSIAVMASIKLLKTRILCKSLLCSLPKNKKKMSYLPPVCNNIAKSGPLPHLLESPVGVFCSYFIRVPPRQAVC